MTESGAEEAGRPFNSATKATEKNDRKSEIKSTEKE
jgi:hypothetical protein